jgi:hypothetical protein
MTFAGMSVVNFIFGGLAQTLAARLVANSTARAIVIMDFVFIFALLFK